MTAPHYISEAKSDMRGIKPGWYAMDDDGNLVSGPFSSREKCVEETFTQRMDNAVWVVLRAHRQMSLPAADRRSRQRPRSNQNRP
jgi:hypothetical protein